MEGNKENSGNSNSSSSEFYRTMVHNFIENQDYESACYWADKLVSMNGGCQQDVYTLGKCLSLSGQYHRAANLLQHYNYEKSNHHFRCLTARCLYMAKEYQKALEILDTATPSIQESKNVWEPADPRKTITAQICLLRGKIYEALMNRTLAAKNYRDALAEDIYCVEALHLLTQHQMLSSSEEMTLLQNLPYEKCGLQDCEDAELVHFLYTTKLKKYQLCGEDVERPTEFPFLMENLDVLTSEAERHFYNCDFQMAHNVCSRVMKQDPFHVGCLPIFIACLVEMKKATELFKVAHKLTEVMSQSALAWYAVGAYYFLIGKQEKSRQNLNKALTLDPVFGPAWLLLGHSFATDKERDQAMASYVKATHVMKGCHLPLIHIGTEYGLSGNTQLASQFLNEAALLAPGDPFVLHEIGVLQYKEQNYEEALKLFEDTRKFVERKTHGVFLKKWEALYNNLGYCCRKLHRYEDALKYHRKSLLLCPGNASTHSVIGLVHAISGNTEAAIESFHKALSFRRDDSLTTTMLRFCVEDLVHDSDDGSDDNFLASDNIASSDEDSETCTRNGTRKESLDNPMNPEGSVEEENPETQDADLPPYLTWFKDSLGRLEAGAGGRNSESPDETADPAFDPCAEEVTSKGEKRQLSSSEESDDVHAMTRRSGRDFESSSEGEQNIGSSSDSEENE